MGEPIVDGPLSAAADLLASETARLVDEIVRVADVEVPSFHSLNGKADEVRDVAAEEVSAVVASLRTPSMLLSVRARESYRRHGERFADLGVALSDVTRLFEIATRVTVPRAIEHLTRLTEGNGAELKSFLRESLHRSTSSVSIVSRAYLDRTAEMSRNRRQVRDAIVHEILTQPPSDTHRAKALALGLTSAPFYAVLTLGGVAKIPDDDRLEEMVQRFFPRSLCIRMGHAFAIVAPLDAADRVLIRQRAVDLISALETLGAHEALITHGRPRPGLEGLREAFLESGSVAAVADLQRRSGVVSERDVQLERLMAATPQVSAELEGILAPLVSYDEGSGGDLLNTLEAFITSGLSIQDAAKALNTHRNTIRYRLDLIERLLGASVLEIKLPLKLALLRRAMTPVST